MNSYLITYEYSYNDEPSKFTTVVEADSYKGAEAVFKTSNNPATIIAMKVLPNPESNYTQLKNHLHNTLELNKSDIRNMVGEAVEDIVNRRLDVLFTDKYDSMYTMQRIIDETIRDKSMSWWGQSEDTLDDYIKKAVVRELLSGVKLKVEITKTKKDATSPGQTLIVRKTKRKT